MSNLPWKIALAGAAILAVAAYAYSAQLLPGQGAMHEQMMGRMGPMHAQIVQGGMHNGIDHETAMNGHAFAGATGVPAMPGQEAFGTIQEIVQILEADPATDWSKVNIAALREHLVDMDEVTLHAAANEQTINNSLVIEVTGEGRTLAAIKRMLPAHVRDLQSIGWTAKADELPNGVKLTVTAADASALVKLKALGFMGIMVQGSHHQLHHLMMAKGEFQH